MSPRRFFASLVGAAALLTALFVGPAGALAQGPATCTPINNVEAIVDDSGSMAVTDSNVLRGQAIKLIINAAPSSFTFGAVSFGDPDVHTLFAPGAVGANKTAMINSLTSLQADDGGTNYGIGFNQAATDNPNRQANIFMTDGENFGDPVPLPQPPTYVIGFGDSAASPDNVAALQNIATSTGGQYFPQTNSSKLVSAVNSILAQITCQSQPQTFNKTFTKVGQSSTNAVQVGKSTHSANFVVSYPTADDAFSFHAALYVHGKKVAAAKVKKHHKLKKLNVTIVKSETFFTARIRGLKAGRLKFTLKATKLGLTSDPTNPSGAVTTQFTPSKKH